MTVATFTTILMIISSLTSLFTEGIKTLKEVKSPNVVAIVVSIVLSVLVGISYPIIYKVGIDTQYIVLMVWECILASLCSMVGYDKVIGIIKQLGAK